MKKIYTTPVIKVKEIEVENAIAAASGGMSLDGDGLGLSSKDTEEDNIYEADAKEFTLWD